LPAGVVELDYGRGALAGAGEGGVGGEDGGGGEGGRDCWVGGGAEVGGVDVDVAWWWGG
jgi:hypothetical protein